MSTTIDGSASVTINSGAILGITSGTAVASTSGTSITFSSLPSWIKRITVMLNAVSSSGASQFLIQIGSGSITTTGYASASSRTPNGVVAAVATYTTGFGWNVQDGTHISYGHIVLTNISGNIWVASHSGYATGVTIAGGGALTLSGVLDRVALTTVNGTDTFDAGSINIFYE